MNLKIKCNHCDGKATLSYYCETCQVIDFGAVFHSQWTPISEGLPKEVGYYLVTSIDSEGVVGVCESKFNGQYFEWYGLCKIANPIAWMSLPLPYENEG